MPTMALRIVADKLDEIPEGLREAAKQDNGLFTVAEMPEGWAVEDISGLRRVLSLELDKRKSLERTLKAFDGIDPDKAGEAREALEKLAAGQLRGSKEIEEYKQQVERKMATERQTLEEKLGKRTAELRERMIRGELAPVIAKLGGGEAMDAILTLASQHVRIEEADDGTLRHSIVDRDGKPRITTKSGSGDPMGYDELIEEMRNASSTRGLFRASSTGGSGGASQTGEHGRGGDSGQRLSARDNIARGLGLGM